MTAMPDPSTMPVGSALSRPAACGLPAHDAQALTAGGNQALIVLGEQVYNLRITRAGKLILTK